MREANLFTSPQDIVEAALAAGLDAIAIVDHNTAEGIDAIREVVKKDGLCVFPGMELTARGGHILAIFEPSTPVQTLRQLLERLGFSEEQWGEGFFQTDYWMDEVFQEIEECGGLAIAAHIDRQPRGFIASSESKEDKIRIHSSDYLSALEITVAHDKPRWNQGKVPYFPKKYACIQGSDAHAIDEIGRRFTYISVPSLDLEGLRLAFSEYEARIRFPHELAEE
jgi:predicted metal-dependent phosphoesterase TrpH